MKIKCGSEIRGKWNLGIEDLRVLEVGCSSWWDLVKKNLEGLNFKIKV